MFMIYKAVAVVVVWCGIWGIAEQVVDAAEKFFRLVISALWDISACCFSVFFFFGRTTKAFPS